MTRPPRTDPNCVCKLQPKDTHMFDDTANDLLRLRNNLRSLLGLSVAGGTDDRIVDAVRALDKEARDADSGLRAAVAQLDARDPSDELAALRRQVAELSFGASSWHKAHAAGAASADPCRPNLAVVTLLIDGLEVDLERDLSDGNEVRMQLAAVRAIRAALGMDAK